MLSIRLSDEAKQHLKHIAEFEGLTVSEYVRRLINEKLEDQYNLSLGEQVYNDHLNNGEKTYTHDEFWTQLGV